MDAEGTKIKVKLPTRVDLAGGTLDLWPIYSFLGGAKTINVAIDIFTYAEITPMDGSEIKIDAPAIQLSKRYSSLTEALDKNDPEISFIYPHLKYWQPQQGFHLYFHSESPIGGGLGGSSSLTVSCISALATFCGKTLSPEETVLLASNIEAELLKKPTGTQDYYPPIHGGLLSLDYGHDGCKVEKLSADVFSTIEKFFLLVYTGSPHHSGFNNWQVLKSFIDGDKKTIENIHALKHTANNLYGILKEKSWNNLPTIFKEEYKYRTQLSNSFSSPEIERLESVALKHGAEAVKICGAGGGGCVFVWVSPEKRDLVRTKLEVEKFKVLSAKPTIQGLL
ncbi:MAG: galactokinase [Bdellovibrionales bacterium]|nr:galactokinase [Bdellovibrionales bacterium]